MAKIVINQNKVDDPQKLITLCPFNAIKYIDSQIIINAACKMCKICTIKVPEVFEYIDSTNVLIDKNQWNGIAVYIEYSMGEVHPVSYELIGKAREMAEKINHPVHAIIIGDNVNDIASEVLQYGVDKVFVYDDTKLSTFKIEPYTAVFEHYVNNNKPSVVLVGGTSQGRSLAPRVAARFKTGLTADCTVLDIEQNSDLDQIRPAFGGNIMAHIHTPNHRPQFATVRYKIFDAPKKSEKIIGEIIRCDLSNIDLHSNITTIEVKAKEISESIEDAEVIVVAGAGVKDEAGIIMVKELASLLGGKVACTRPLIEKGIMDARHQIGLSGRTVRPKLIITCGVSGAIQFVAGMSGAENIIAINKNSTAPIFKVAHYALIGDLYEVLPTLINDIKEKM